MCFIVFLPSLLRLDESVSIKSRVTIPLSHLQLETREGI